MSVATPPARQPEVERGRHQLRIVVAWFVSVVVGSTIVEVSIQTPTLLVLARLILTAALACFLWQGRAWARWVTAVLLLAYAVTQLTLVAELGFGVFALLLVIVSAVSILLAIWLVRSTAMRAVSEARQP